ncbi:MAG TPA: YggS family pyridoxal phosphate-dependent enzyme [Burkholderiaceae bacterium]|nr:YggS family pyridoxal phosphate-dependent enzyme [Burkholderiaceae bacterium]HQR68989.1 YggS family pyridoxal phosphate-dependent enzyme [Burkholderiaceae bacterium]
MRDALQANLQGVHERITKAARGAGRAPESVVLVAVSKTFPAEAVAAALACGQVHFGENYAQEGVEKIARVRDLAPASAPCWHFIGPVQSNKTRTLAEHFDWVQSVDRLKIAERLSQQRPPSMPPLDVLLQVNISGETTKSGVAPADLTVLARAVASLPRLRLRGLMAIPEPEGEPGRQVEPLLRMRRLFDEMRVEHPGCDTLSMGMSADLEAAVAAGSTMVRIGTAIFGQRERKAA